MTDFQEQSGFTYYECPDCGFDCIHPADYKPRSTACPLCEGDSGHDVGMIRRTARSTDKPEGKDARVDGVLGFCCITPAGRRALDGGGK